MQKPLALSIAVCLGLTSCQLVEKSPIWETAMNVRPGDSFREPDPSSSYAERLHRALLEQGVEHLVVTYQYHYYTHQYEEALGTRTAVVYRDDANSHYPWWLKDDRTATPFWLPNGELDKQLSFYARRPVQVLEKKVYPARAGSGKAAVAHFRPPQVQSRDHVAEHPQPVTKIAQAKPIPKPPAKEAVTTYHAATAKPIAPSPTVSPAVVTRIQHPPTVVVSKPKPASVSAPAPALATRSNPFSTPAPEAATEPVAQTPEPASNEDHFGKLFRMRNGTTYDPSSAMDRRKMEQLKQGPPGNEVSSESGLRGGTDGVDLSR